MSWIEPLDLEQWLVNTFAGTTEIFTYVAMIAMAIMAARFQMPNSVAAFMFLLFALIMNQFLNFGGMFILILFASIFSIFYLIKKLLE